MSAPVAARTSSSAIRAGAVAHRWGGVVGDSINTFLAVGVRCDDEDGTIGESLVVELGPGQIKARAPLPFAVRSVSGSAQVPLFLDEHGGLWSLGVDDAPVKRLDDVVAIDGPLVLDRAGVVQRVDGGTLRLVTRGARGIGAGVIVGDDTITLLRDDGSVGDTHAFVAPGLVRAAHRREHHVGVYVDQTFHTLDLETGVRQAFMGPKEAHCLARAADRWFIGCTLGGLLTVDDGDDRIRVFRPSLRARQIVRVRDGLVAVSDLAIATSDDGQEWLARDLTGFVRLIERGG